jgi:hypothetical protein
MKKHVLYPLAFTFIQQAATIIVETTFFYFEFFRNPTTKLADE